MAASTSRGGVVLFRCGALRCARMQDDLDLERRPVRPGPDVDMRGGRVSVVSDLRDDLPRLHTLPFLYLNFSHVGVEDGDIPTLEENPTGLTFPFRARCIRRVGTLNPSDGPVERRKDISPPPEPVFVSLALGAAPVRTPDPISARTRDQKTTSQLIPLSEFGSIFMLPAPEIKIVCVGVDHWMYPHRLGERISVEAEPILAFAVLAVRQRQRSAEVIQKTPRGRRGACEVMSPFLMLRIDRSLSVFDPLLL